MSQRNNVEVVLIDSLDGFEFEDLCARIYQRLGYEVSNIRATGDEGRDLILRRADTGEDIVAECKHWPGKTVGRPVVQKLHSAMMTYPAKNGAVITTGSFAGTAAQYIDKISEHIELIDLVKLRGLALRAGIQLATKSDPMPLRAYPLRSEQSLMGALNEVVFSRIISTPSKAVDLFDIKVREIAWRAAYAIQYSIYQDFSTAALDYELNIRRSTLLLDAHNGKLWSTDISAFLGAVRSSDMEDAPSISGMPQFALDMTEVKQRATRIMQDTHSTSKVYRGRNNQTYQKECVPSTRNITVHDLQQVYVPEQTITLRAVRSDYSTRIVEGSGDLFYINHPTLQCRHCALDTLGARPVAGPLSIHAQICNSCGAITHPSAWIFPHSFRCASCQKTICRQCSYWTPKLVVFKRILCGACASALPPEKIEQVEKTKR